MLGTIWQNQNKTAFVVVEQTNTLRGLLLTLRQLGTEQTYYLNEATIKANLTEVK